MLLENSRGRSTSASSTSARLVLHDFPSERAGCSRVTGWIERMAEMTGVTVKEALKASRGHAVLAMKEGRIARALLEKISTDLRSLFRKNENLARISCLLGIIDMT